VAGLSKVDLKPPGVSGFERLTAAVDQSTEVTGAYAAFVNVTGQVRRAGSGVYTVANVQSATGEDRYAGWALVVAYEAAGEPPRNLTVFDGLQSVTQSKPAVTIPVSGFQTPLSGPVRTKLGFVAYEGDRGLTGDSATLDGKALSDKVNAANNFFNSAISVAGQNLTDKMPDYVNQLGFDAKLIGIDGLLANGATSATIGLKTSSDQYLPHVITFATDLYAPVIRATKTVANLTHRGGPTRAGDRLRYTVTFANEGLEEATNFVATDKIPTDTTYVAGSLRILAGHPRRDHHRHHHRRQQRARHRHGCRPHGRPGRRRAGGRDRAGSVHVQLRRGRPMQPDRACAGRERDPRGACATAAPGSADRRRHRQRRPARSELRQRLRQDHRHRETALDRGKGADRSRSGGRHPGARSQLRGHHWSDQADPGSNTRRVRDAPQWAARHRGAGRGRGPGAPVLGQRRAGQRRARIFHFSAHIVSPSSANASTLAVHARLTGANFAATSAAAAVQLPPRPVVACLSSTRPGPPARIACRSRKDPSPSPPARAHRRTGGKPAIPAGCPRKPIARPQRELPRAPADAA
jgi:uncharacterized repeat protein (TIGR01451 family)